MTDQDDFSSSTPAEAGPLITPDDLANVEEFLIGRDFEADLGVATVPLSAAIRKPTKSEWIRTHPTFQRSMFVLKVRDSEARGETFLLSKAVAKLVPESATAAFLVLVVNRAGALFFWPLAVPDERENAWHQTALKAMAEARKRWVRVVPDMNAGAYVLKTTEEPLPDPEWPTDADVEKLFGLALEKRGIRDPGHDLIKHLLTGA